MIKGLCTPLVIYIVLCVIGVVGQVVGSLARTGNIQLAILLSHVGMNVLFGGLMYILCRSGLVGVSWILLFLPIIMMMIVGIIMFGGGLVLLSVLKNKDSKKRVKKHETFVFGKFLAGEMS